MAENLEFVVGIEQNCIQILDNARQFAREIASEVSNKIIDKTPVDTGVTKANWMGNIGAPSEDTTGSADPSGSATKAAVEEKIKNWDVLKEDFYLTNNTPQAVVLEFGLYPNPPLRGTYIPRGKSKHGIAGPRWVKFSQNGYSKLAPHGMVGVTLSEMNG